MVKNNYWKLYHTYLVPSAHFCTSIALTQSLGLQVVATHPYKDMIPYK
jgi:hypothetical protein